ncbi:hypothetical protein ACJMK2_007558 [Sinanodonta woodiana]|uniref:G-protein coupled receptors family 1 profile domain-containing protein n=1 Tax=Sinanodonta woodiana TaxID=1069815 RepID=A0ABD3VIW9_SINWO
MAHINSRYDNHEGSDMPPDYYDMYSDYYISWTNSSEKSALNGSHNNSHLHPNRSDSDLDSQTEYYQFTDFSYSLHDFEGKIYVSVWTFLVFLTAFGNFLIVAVFVRKSMRSTTNLILILIAISDTLTGLVTLPTYIHVFTSGNVAWILLNEGWCEAFMISKLYIFKVLHTVSVWQKLLLAFQRCICVWFPFKTQSWFTTRRTLIAVAIITVCAFVIHSYHLNERKADKIRGFCHWNIEKPCVETCIFLGMTLLFVNILPCQLLLVLTILMIQKLFHPNIHKQSFSAENNRERAQQNMRASIIVVCVAIIVLIPEISYGIFILVTIIKEHSDNYIMPLEAHRLFHLIYEIALMISFHANFWVYIIMNRRFRDQMKSMFRNGINKLLPKRAFVPITTVSREMNTSRSHSTKETGVNEQSNFL